MDHEEEFLNTFFAQVAQLCTDKAKELVEKERGSCRQTQMGPWGMLLMHLPQIAVAEHSYADLGFLHTKNKGFLRKDNSLRTVYESLKSDLKRVEEMTRGTNSIGATVAEVSNQLCQYITAKIQLIDFYEKMYNMSINSKTMKYQELLQCIEGIVEIHSLSCSHLALTAIKASLTLECEILVQLTKAQVELQHWRFLSTLMALYGAQTRMSAWERTLQSKESWKLGFSASFLKANQQPALYQCQQASPGEMRSIMSKQNVDYYHKIQSFQRKHDVLAVLIIFDSRGVEDAGLGYRHPRREPNTSEQFPVVLSCPSVFVQKPSIHLDNIQKRIKERHTELLAMDKIIYYKNVKDICTYAMYNTDPRMTLVTVSENGKQKDKEAHIASFMTDLCVQIRCNKIYESLKLSK
ncbi:KICSTOR subunit 2 isoform X3 [Bombus vancouverensis nearcticus]|uniref:KICSTOR complex protein C12orf66 homolog isoform X3 n=1 Tax=Bombus bifarius TaxID=103933 RepID=A0A6P8MKV7_9HYME|nr:KICSTOR complex protein C12orf66 homolog isoform X3 [Bombus vancouverensis nearcticus]XP_033302627.1 KICSTOR complex protein C12orf66 homolog isoform X3 [Bombus bifarius]